MFPDAFLGPKVGEYQAEALGIALCPFEVVVERPYEIAAQVDALGDRRVGGGEVTSQVLDALGVADLAARVDVVVKGGTVLGYVDRDVPIVAADA